MAGNKNLFGESFHFNERFLQDHAEQIASNPKIALIELIANAYDAGAQQVTIHWPDDLGGEISVSDDGVGLTRNDFEYRWTFFNYNRTEEQGAKVVFPHGVTGIRRVAFGQSGKGRYAPFCFARRYTVESRKGGSSFKATVSLTEGGMAPFVLSDIQEGKRKGHGTTVSVNIQNPTRLLPVDDVRNLIGSKFLVDPSISIVLNDSPVELLDLSGVESETFTVESYGDVVLHFVDAEKHSRIAKLNGIAWWVNRKMVGEPNWNRFGNDGVKKRHARPVTVVNWRRRSAASFRLNRRSPARSLKIPETRRERLHTARRAIMSSHLEPRSLSPVRGSWSKPRRTRATI